MANTFAVGPTGGTVTFDDSGNIIAAGSVQATGDFGTSAGSVTADTVAALSSVEIGDETVGLYSSYDEVSGTTSLSTGGATTSIDANIPAGAVITDAAVKVSTAIAGTGAGATGALTCSGGSSATLVSSVSLTLSSEGHAAVSAETTAETDLVYTLSGGAGSDNTPSAGAIRWRVRYRTTTALV